MVVLYGYHSYLKCCIISMISRWYIIKQLVSYINFVVNNLVTHAHWGGKVCWTWKSNFSESLKKTVQFEYTLYAYPLAMMIIQSDSDFSVYN